MDNDKTTNDYSTPVALIVSCLAILGLYLLFHGWPSGASSSVISTVYTTNTANIRSCAASDCNIVQTFGPNTSFDIGGDYGEITAVYQLPEWVKVTYAGTNGAESTGYISRDLLSDRETTQTPTTQQDQTNSTPSNPTTQEAQPQSTSPTSASLSATLINQIEPTIVEINCYPPNSSSYWISGSGTSIRQQNGLIKIETNYHVYAEANTAESGLPTCYAVYPEAPNFSYNGNYGDYQLILEAWHYNPNTYEDSAIFSLGPPVIASTPLSHIPAINDLPQFPNSGCSNVDVGDGLTVFGYPSSGNLLGISETVTQGIVSGLPSGPIYKTDAPIDHGNSGGIAVLNKVPCILGIPTLGESGLTAGIGYIQSFHLAAQ